MTVTKRGAGMHDSVEHSISDDIVEHIEIREYSTREVLEYFDRMARFHLDISGNEFRKRWHRGDYDDDPDRPGVVTMAMLLPMVERREVNWRLRDNTTSDTRTGKEWTMHEHTEHLVLADIVEHVEIREYTPEEALKHFDAAAQFHLNISGDEFRERWHRGDYDDDPDRPEVMAVAMLLPMVERETATYP